MLDEMNRTELQALIRELESVNSHRETAKKSMIDAVDGVADPVPCPLQPQREEMEKHIQKNYRRLRTQLPGCDGRCTTFGCPNLIVVRCWVGIRDDIL